MFHTTTKNTHHKHKQNNDCEWFVTTMKAV